jgi:pimeloyl-ACP methyl ester carboxylesterase
MTAHKQNLLLLHGALGSKKNFDELAPSLTENFNLFSIDLLGHGAYCEIQELNVELLCSQIINFIENNNLKGTHVFGYSMGGYLALLCSLFKPELLGKIITLATKFNWSEEIAEQESKQLNALIHLPDEHPFKKQLIELHGNDHWKKCINHVNQLILEIGAKNFMGYSEASQIKSNVLLIVGELDAMVTTDETSNIKQHIPNSKIKILSNTKHPFEKVNKPLLANIITDFLKI